MWTTPELSLKTRMQELYNFIFVVRKAARTASNSRMVEPVSVYSGVKMPLHNSTLGPWARH